jgi:hypothetical protein
MIIAKIDDERFVELVCKSPLIAFQKVEFGYAVAAPGEAYYAPMDHPGGGNLPLGFGVELGAAFIRRMSTAALRTLRPTAKPIPTQALVNYLRNAFGDSPEPMQHYEKIGGCAHPIADYQCQIVILAIEENERPDLKDAMAPLKREMMSDALVLVIGHAEAALELLDDKPMLVRLNVLQASQAMKTALEMLLRP